MAELDLTHPTQPAPDTKALADIQDAETQDRALMRPGSEALGSVSYDGNSRAPRLPMFKIRAPMSKNVLNPAIENGMASLDLEHIVCSAKGVTRITFLTYKEWYEDNVDIGMEKKSYATLAEARKAGKSLDRPATGGKPTLREVAKAMILIAKPDDLNDAAFPFVLDGKRYALARWYMNGYAVWGPGHTLTNKLDFELKPVGMIAAEWELTTKETPGKLGPYWKPITKLLPARHTKEFQEAVKALFEKTKDIPEDPVAE